MRFRFLSAMITMAVLTAGALPGRAAAALFTEVTVSALAGAPDGSLWFLLRSNEFWEAGGEAGDVLEHVATDGTVRAYPLPASIFADSIAVDHGGTVWFTDEAYRIGRMLPDGRLQEFVLPGAAVQDGSGFPYGIVLGPDGNMWFELDASYERPGAIGRITPSGAIAEFTVSGSPASLSAAPDNQLWFTSDPNNSSWRITTAGEIGPLSFSLLGVHGAVGQVSAGRDGSLWLSDAGRRLIRRTPAGAVRTYLLPSPACCPVAASDGGVWLVAWPRLGRLSPAGVYTTYALPRGVALGTRVAGPDGQLWFQAEPQNGSSGDEGALNWTSWIGRVTPSGKMSFLPVRTGLTPLSLYSTSQVERDRWAGEQEAGSDPHLVLWTAGESRPPRPIGRFPAGTRAIAYYLSFLGAQPDATTYQAVIRDVWGGVLVRGVTHTLTLSAGALMASFSYDPAFTPGLYRLDIEVGGQSIATTDFTVGN